MYLNKALVIGNLTRDPELRSLPSGVSVSTFSIATNRIWNNKEGQRQESTDYHNVVVFGRQADVVAQYLRKGSMALVEGRMQTRSWETEDGQKRYRTEIVAERVQFGPRSGGRSTPASEEGEVGATPKSSKEDVPTIQYPDEDGINPDDIPF
jgi:single-strand DNA-binding protein